MMVYDCFTFFNELDILDIRLHTMDPFVDRFVLVESEETFSGIKKPLYFEENKGRFKEFLPKIIHLVAPLVDENTEAWERQEIQRNYAVEGLKYSCFSEDLILVSDVDEIIGVDPVEIQGDSKEQTSYIHQNYMFYMNLRRPGAWPGLVAIPFDVLKDEYDFKGFVAKYNMNLWEVRRLRRYGKKVHSGWHFSNMGGKDAVVTKVKASCHHDLDSYKRMASDSDYLHDIMEGAREIKGRYLHVVPIDDSYPKWFRENLEKFEHLLTKEDLNGNNKRVSEVKGT